MKEQNVASEILSDIVTHMKYAKYIPELKRRETYEEIIDRNKAMHVRRYPELKKEIDEAYDYVYDRQVLPSGRSLQFAGKAIEVSPARIFNCSALAIKDIKAFSEVMFLLLMGCGTGYSVQKAHIRQLPPLQGVEKPVGKQRKKRYLVQDSIVGWADAIKALMESYFYHEREIDYDFSDIRKKGAPLVTSGGKAPGPEPLRVCLNKIASLLENVVATRGPGTKLTPLEAHDILCFLADAVLCGGIRRSASICLFSLDDKEMLECKFGDWWETNPQRGRANNSAVIDRSLITKEVFDDLWDKVEASGSGEPGLFFSNDVELLTNPCCFTGDMEITTNKGEQMFSKLDGKTALIWNGEEYTEASFWKVGEKPTIELILSTGKHIRCTADHEFMTVDGDWVEAKDSHKKRLSVISESKIVSDIEAVKLGFLQGDGVLSRLASKEHLGLEINIGSKDKEIFELFDLPESDAKAHYVVGYNDRLRELEFSQDVLPDREFPQKYFDSLETLDIKGDFLRGMYSANGCVVKGARIAYKTTCFSLATSLVDALKEFGIQPYITTNKPTKVKFLNGEYLCKQSYDVNIYPLAEVLLFAKYIGFEHKYKNDSLKELIKLKSPMVKYMRDGEVETVYDFNEPKKNCGFVQGVKAHNCEISLQSYSFCNLTTLNASTVETQEDLNTRVRMAARIATLQAGYTDFYYLRKEWRELVEEEALIGVSMTGLASENVLSLNFKEAAQIVKDENEEFAAKMGINKAHRTTCVKPEGCQVPETLIVSDKGIFTLDELGDKAGEDWQKLRYGITSVATDKNIQEVGKFYNNGFKDTKKITLDSGLILEATHNHMYRVLRDDAYVWVEAKDIIEGDILPYALGSYTGGTYQEFQYSQIIDEHSHNSIMLPEQYVLDEDFAWLLGLYNADGSNHAKGIRISGNWNERKGFDKAQRIIKEKFGLDSTITKHNQNETDLRCQLVVNSTYLPKMFEEFGILKGRSDEIVVPLAVRMSPPSVIKSFYDGFFVGDGNFNDVKAPSFSTTSREFAMSTVVILRSLGIDCKVRLVGRRVGNYGDKQQYWVSVRQGRSVEHRYVSIHNREIWKKLDDLGMSNLSFDTVISIEDSENYTLDIEVPESNTYVANSYISHNTASLVLGTSSGVHAWYADYYWRRVSVGKEEAIYSYLAENHPELVEDDYFRPSTMAKIKVPQKAPEGAMLRYETALDTLERVKMLSLDWIQEGHREGDNFNNVSCTISVRDNEWDEVGEWMWENRDNYTGIAVLPFDGGSYTQSPFEECTKEEYEEAMKHLTNIDLTQVIEEDDMTDLQGEVACGGGACEIT